VKHRFRRAVILVLLLMITFVFPLLAPPQHRIDPEHFRLIKGGMTEAELEAIFGVPAGGYDWAVRSPDYPINVLTLFAPSIQDGFPPLQAALFREVQDGSGMSKPNLRARTWVSRHGVFHVILDERGRVAITGSGWETVRIEPPWRKWWDKLVSFTK
jgi:hypothetical protein